MHASSHEPARNSGVDFKLSCSHTSAAKAGRSGNTGRSGKIGPTACFGDLVRRQQQCQSIAQGGRIMVSLARGAVEPAIGGDRVAWSAQAVRI